MRFVIYVFIPTGYVIYLFISRVCLRPQSKMSALAVCAGACDGDLDLAVVCTAERRGQGR